MCNRYSILATYLHDSDQEWDLIPLLRRLCLREEIDPVQLRALVRERLLRADGSVEPVLKDVVLSSVRGEDNLLRMESPFVNALDRVMGEYLLARGYLRCHLERDDAAAFLALDPVQNSLDRLRRARNSPPGDDTDWPKNRGPSRA